jgi:hypothetical protein
VQAEVIAAPFHQRRLERDAERLLERGQILVEDLLLEVFRAGGHQHAMAAQNRGDEIRQRLARAGARFGEQGSAVLDDLRNRLRHAPLPFPRLVAVEDAGKRTCLGKCLADGSCERGRVQARRSG